MRETLEDKTSQDGSTCCCAPGRTCDVYCNEVKRKAFQKKPISIDISHLLKTELKRCLKTLDLTAYGVASMLGGTIFVLTGTVARNKTGPASFLAYIFAGIVALLNAMNYAELACRFPKAGSTYTYAYVMLGEMPAFLAGWSILLEYILGVSAVARGWSSCLNSLADNTIMTWTIENLGTFGHPNGFFAEYIDLVAGLVVILVATSTCFGIEKSSWLNLLFTAVNISVLCISSIFMLVYAKPELILVPLPDNMTWTSALPQIHMTPFLPYGFGGLVAGIATFFNAFIGFDMISMCAEEAAKPEKSIPRANIISVLLVTLLLSVATLSLTMYIPWYTMDVGAPFLEALRLDSSGGGDNLVKNVLFYVVGVGCLIGVFSNMLTSAIAAPRIVYAMAQDGLIFSGFAQISEPFKTPLLATIPVALIGCLLSLIFGIDSLADFLSLGTLIAYSMSSIGVILLRYSPPPESIILASSSNSISPTDSEKDETLKKPINVDSTQFSAMDLPPIAAARIDQPGYLKRSWANCMPKSLVTKMTINWGPGELCKVILVIFILSVIGLLFTVLIIPLWTSRAWFIWRMVGGTLWIFVLLACTLGFTMHQQFRAPRPNLFRLFMVPFIPCATIVLNTVLISQLSWMTWVRFGIWNLLGGAIYFTYGVCHSNPSDTVESDVLLQKEVKSIN